MRKVFCYLIIAFLLVNLSYAQKQTLFLDKDYNTVLQEAQANRKPIVMMFYATWCAHCNAMKNTTFKDANVVNFYEKNFNCIAIDAETPVGIALKTKFENKFKVKSFPTFAFFDADENLLYAVAGEFKSDKFITEGTNVLVAENQVPNLKSKFEADVSNPTNCINYIVALRKAGLNATSVAETYLRTVPEKNQFSALNWRIIANGISDIDSNEFLFVLKNKEEFAKVASPERVDRKIVNAVSENFTDYYVKSDTINYNSKKQFATTLQNRKVDSLIFVFDMAFASNAKNWKKYQKVTEANVEKFAYNDSNLLNEICTNYLNQINDLQGLQNAVKWSNQSINLSESKDKYIMTTKLLMKMKAYDKALDSAEQGKEFVKSNGWKTTDFDNLITEIKK